MLHLLWTYYAPDEVARAVVHIDVLVEKGQTPEDAADDAARIYRQRMRDRHTPFVRGHLLRQWRIRRGGGPGAMPGLPEYASEPVARKYPTEVSFRAFFHRLFYE